MGDHEDTNSSHQCRCGEETEGGRSQSAGEEGECCGSHGTRHERAGAGEQRCGCGDASPAAAEAGAEHASRHGHGAGCCSGGHGEHGRHGPRGPRRMPTPAERITMLEQYLKDLKAEALAVDERLAQLKAVA